MPRSQKALERECKGQRGSRRPGASTRENQYSNLKISIKNGGKGCISYNMEVVTWRGKQSCVPFEVAFEKLDTELAVVSPEEGGRPQEEEEQSERRPEERQRGRGQEGQRPPIPNKVNVAPKKKGGLNPA